MQDVSTVLWMYTLPCLKYMDISMSGGVTLSLAALNRLHTDGLNDAVAGTL
jgi:hypothetical protein